MDTHTFYRIHGVTERNPAEPFSARTHAGSIARTDTLTRISPELHPLRQSAQNHSLGIAFTLGPRVDPIPSVILTFEGRYRAARASMKADIQGGADTVQSACRTERIVTDDPRDLVWIEDPGQGAHSFESDPVPAGATACCSRLCKPDDHPTVATFLLGSLFLSSPKPEHRTGGIMWRRKCEGGYQA